MNSYQVTASAAINAPAAQVYAILADYHDGHPRILPKPYFAACEVVRGGIGAGTIIRFQTRALGKVRNFSVSISEPEPGRVLKETDLVSGVATTFTVNPRANEKHAQVTITSELKARDGMRGRLERFLSTLLLRYIYFQELKLLAAFAEKRDDVRVRPATPSAQLGFLYLSK